MSSITRVVKTLILQPRNQVQPTIKRNLWQYLNIIFNRKDEQRWKKFGPDRTCSEWILRNGGQVKLTCCPGFVSDYNLIPPEGVQITLQAVDATESSIMHYGFDHFIGCTSLHQIILNKCNYVYDQALEELKPISGQLIDLTVTDCPNVTESGLKYLADMKALKTLKIGHLQSVGDIKNVAIELKKVLPSCNITVV